MKIKLQVMGYFLGEAVTYRTEEELAGDSISLGDFFKKLDKEKKPKRNFFKSISKEPHSFNILINNERFSFNDASQTELHNGDTVSILSPFAGG
jgi:molybdopterin converting factor small subunit